MTETTATPVSLPVAPPPMIRLRELSLAVPGRVLLERASLEVRAGETILVVGPSGAGKSVLLRLLTGLIAKDDDDHEIGGAFEIGGQDALARPEAAAERTSLVFQDHALFDEMSVRENVLFARDHSPSKSAAQAAERALAFLARHAIPLDARVRTLSGGMRQRVAVARALARDPEVVLYDEPTSALDPRSARAVAELIREAAETFGKTSIVVTHDYAPFENVARRAIFLDPRARTLREVPFAEVASVMAEASVEARAVEPEPEASPLDLARAGAAGASEAIFRFFAETPRAIQKIVEKVPLALAPTGARARWFGRELAHFARICFVGSAVPYMVIAGAIAGFVSTYFTYKFMPRPDLTRQLFMDDVLPALGFATYRVIVPVLATILIAGRTGAALASDHGNRVYLHKTLAMRTLGAPVEPYLLTASLWMNLVGTVVLALIAYGAASFTSLVVFTWTQPDYTPFYWAANWGRKLQPWHLGLFGKGAGWVLGKLLFSGAGTAAIAYAFGMRPKRSAADVSKGITATVYWATVFVLLVHFAFALFEFDPPKTGEGLFPGD